LPSRGLSFFVKAGPVDNSVEMVENLRSLLSLSDTGENRSEIIGVFAKEPVPGEVKTRLCPPLTPVQAAELYRAALMETVDTLRTTRRPLVLFFAGGKEFFQTAFPDLPLVPQADGNLGRRMAAALESLLGAGFRTAALVGSDSPDLPASLVKEAFEVLRTAEAAVIPARDGGYVLVGESRHSPALFRDIPWSGPRVLEITRGRATEAGIDFREIGEWEDFDDQASLRRLCVRSPRSATARLAAGMFAKVEEP